MLGDIFAGSLSKFREPVNLKKLIGLIDETQWSAIDVDIKADAYEGLLQKYAEEEKGAGQYFTPREAIRCVVRCIKPDSREKPDFTMHDPAVGTAGFLIGAYEWMMKQTKEGALLSREERERLQNETFSGGEIVLDTRRLALMNLYLHQIEADVYFGDSLAEGSHTSKRYDVVMTNPPFGTKGAGQAPVRDDFTVGTANKQLNFVQHVITILKPGGKCGMVVPDNVLFEDTAGKEVRKLLMEDCNLHTILRLPIGTFTPYSAGVKANIIFFKKGEPTKEVWVYDKRTNVEKVAIRHPLTHDYFRDFEDCFHRNPRIETDRFRSFPMSEVEKRDYNLDIVWLDDESTRNKGSLLDPEELVSETTTSLQTALDSLNELGARLANSGSVANGKTSSNSKRDLPEGWINVKLMEIANLKYGEGLPKARRAHSGLFPVYGSNGIVGYHDKVITKGPTIIIGRKGSVGAVNKSEKACWPIDTTYFIDDLPAGIDFDFLYHFLRSQPLADLDKSTAIPGINRDDLYSRTVPLPPFAEQGRIVSQIESFISYITTASLALRAAPDNFKLLEESILSKAFRGELVPQDPRDEPASTLLERIRSQPGVTGRSKSQSIPEMASPRRITPNV